MLKVRGYICYMYFVLAGVAWPLVCAVWNCLYPFTLRGHVCDKRASDWWITPSICHPRGDSLFAFLCRRLSRSVQKSQSRGTLDHLVISSPQSMSVFFLQIDLFYNNLVL